MLTYDVIVIGAGPAGASAAAAAARAGMRVALLEKHALPRHKTCGGGMPMVVGDTLRDLVPEAFLEADVRYMRHTWRFGDAHMAEINPPGEGRQLSLWMAQRSIFDNALAQRAADAGADLLDAQAVRSVERDTDTVTVKTIDSRSGREAAWRAPHVIGADGANGTTAKAANLRLKRAIAIGQEVEHPHRWGDGHVDLRPDVIHLEYGAVPRGYAWVFPKGDHLNVGAGVFRPRRIDGRGESGIGEELRRTIFAYMDSLGVPYQPEKMRFHAYPLPIWNGREPLNTPDGRILLAGDAAGLINPLFGDGILHAIKSGIIAAECLAEEKPREYTRRIHLEFADNFDAALRLSKFFYQFTGTVYKYGIKRPSATRAATRLLCGDALFTDIAGRAIRIIRRSLATSLSTPGQAPGSGDQTAYL